MRRTALACLLNVAVILAGCASAVGATFTGLNTGDYEPAGSTALAVSHDGATVVGFNSKGVRWTASGAVNVPDFAGSAQDVSADGTVIVGHGHWSVSEAYRWTASTGLTRLTPYSESGLRSAANGVSAGGSVIVGEMWDSERTEAFIWTEESGVVGLGFLDENDRHSSAADVSADGSVVVGTSETGYSEAFIWTKNGGMVGLGDLPGGKDHSYALGVSANGLVVVGGGVSANGGEAFRWTQASGMVGLGLLTPDSVSSVAWAANADGSVIIGNCDTGVNAEAFIWDANHGMRALQEVLINEYGLGESLAGWQLTSAYGISPDGNYIVGSGYNPRGVHKAWKVSLVPEPETQVLLVVGGAIAIAVSLRKRFRSRGCARGGAGEAERNWSRDVRDACQAEA
jgi:probable HAF family extracellular repeat protein